MTRVDDDDVFFAGWGQLRLRRRKRCEQRRRSLAGPQIGRPTRRRVELLLARRKQVDDDAIAVTATRWNHECSAHADRRIEIYDEAGIAGAEQPVAITAHNAVPGGSSR